LAVRQLRAIVALAVPNELLIVASGGIVLMGKNGLAGTVGDRNVND
jgi:hypothetical protein